MTTIAETAWPTAQGEVKWTLCPGCQAPIYLPRLEDNLRVCPQCNHHLPVSIEARIAALIDEDSFERLAIDIAPRDPLGFADTQPYSERHAKARRKTGHDDAMIVGTARVGGHAVVIAALDFAFMGGSMGSNVGTLFGRAAEEALTSRTPLVMIAASGGARMQEGALSLMQLATTSQWVGRLREAGVATINVNTHPTYGGATASFAMLGDVIIAEPGARIGFAGPNVIRNTIRQELPAGFQSAEFLLEHGMVDLVVRRDELPHRLSQLLGCLGTAPAGPRLASSARPDMHVLGPSRPAADVVRLAREIGRPTTLEYAARLFDDMVVLAGDRTYADDPALVGGVGRVGDRGVVFLGHQKAHDTTGLTARNFGMPRPEGYRKAARLMRLAERLRLPVVTFVDTPGAYPGVEAEERGQGTAIAESILTSARLRVPVVTVVTGEGGSGGALALATANQVLMAENAYYSVISPEGCSTILFGSAAEAARTAELLHLRATDLADLGIIDTIVPEPPDGAHAEPGEMADRVARAIVHALDELAGLDADQVVAHRQQRFARFAASEGDGRRD